VEYVDSRISAIFHVVSRVREFISGVIVGNAQAIDILLSTVIAGGHSLIMGPVGSGKTPWQGPWPRLLVDPSAGFK
jgi:hypothetical protein